MNLIARTGTALTGLAALALVLAGCATADQLGAAPGDDTAIVVGSQDYYSNEIIAEIYAQALEAGGFTVTREFRIGQREVYLQELESGSLDLFPEYSGPTLVVWEPETAARSTDDVYAALLNAAPEGLQVLEQSAATDQDTYVVTREFSERYGVTSIADLADVPVDLTMGGNSEGEDRPNGPQGLEKYYGVSVGFTPIEDGGGPLTVKALKDDQVQLAIMYTASPDIDDPDLVQLEDPAGLFLASNVVPIASDSLSDSAVDIIDSVSAALTPEGLIELNRQSVENESPASTIAAHWLSENNLD
jgi:osmoprotectant transport system substrate-binding protein